MARIEVRLTAEVTTSDEPLDLGLHTLEGVGYDLTEAAALKLLKAGPDLDYKVEEGILEFAGAIIPLASLKQLRAEIVSRYAD